MEYRLRRYDGHYRWILDHGIPRHAANGDFLGYIGSCVDVHERKEAETALRESQERVRAIVETAVDGVITIDDAGIIESVNPAGERIFQYSERELIGRNVKILMPEPDHSGHDSYLKHYRETGERKIIGIGREVMGRRKDDSLFPLELSISESMLPAKRFFTGIVRDISQRKQAETALKESQQDLNSAQALAHVGSWRLNVVRNELSWSDESYRIAGVPRGTPLTYESFMAIVHPDDRAYVEQKWKAALRGEPYAIEHRFVVRGEIRWAREEAQLEMVGVNSSAPLELSMTSPTRSAPKQSCERRSTRFVCGATNSSSCMNWPMPLIVPTHCPPYLRQLSMPLSSVWVPTAVPS
jgi:two-component system CheB/CheR fusion protein